MMKRDEIIKEFEAAEAILRGHFVLSSGLHSDTYLQCARVLMDSVRAERLCRALADKVRKKFGAGAIDIVVSPAMGGVVVGYEMGRQLGVPAIFCERENGVFILRRGFSIQEGARVLVVEDVVTTGKSSQETFACVREHGGEVIGEACLVNRSGSAEPLVSRPRNSLNEFRGRKDTSLMNEYHVYPGNNESHFRDMTLEDTPLVSLLDLDVKTYAADNLPEALRNIPAVKPGSRWLKSTPPNA